MLDYETYDKMRVYLQKHIKFTFEEYIHTGSDYYIDDLQISLQILHYIDISHDKPKEQLEDKNE